MEQKPSIPAKPEDQEQENEEKLILGPEDVNLNNTDGVQPEDEKIFTPSGRGGRIFRGPFGSF